MIKLLRYSLLLASLLHLQAAHTATLNISVPSDVHLNYLELLDGKQALEIDNYSQARRSSAEVLLLVQMLKIGGFKDQIRLLPFSREDYAPTKLRNTSAHMLSASEWLNEINRQNKRENQLISSAIVKKGEYKVGLYTHPKHLGLKNSNNLSGLSATTHRLWQADISTLNELQIDSIHFSNSYDLMLKMVKSGRVDLMLASFKNTPDMALITQNIKLTPIKGVQVGINDSRHWAFLNSHDEVSLKAHAALETGIKVFRQQGRIQRAFTESGFFNQRTSSWRLLGDANSL